MSISDFVELHHALARSLLWLAATLVLAAGCAASERGSRVAESASTSTATIEALIGTAACDTDAQCKTVGIGAKPCGGPQSYRAWSRRATDAGALMRAVERQASAARAKSADAGILSNCAVVADPGAYCAAPAAAADAGSAAGVASAPPSALGQCRLRPRGAGGAGAV